MIPLWEGTFLCKLDIDNSQRDSCEIDIMYERGLERCQIKSSDKKYQIIKTNQDTIYVNTFRHQVITWGCAHFEKMFEVNNSVWIRSLPGCHVRIANQIFMVPAEVGSIETEPSLVSNDGHMDRFKYDFHVQIQNTTALPSEYANRSTVIDIKLEQLTNQTSGEVHRILLPNTVSIGTYLIETIFCLFIIIIIAIIIIIRCTRK